MNQESCDTKTNVPKMKPKLITMITSKKYRNLAELLENVDSVDALLDYLDKELRDFQQSSVTKAFKKHHVDGYAFQNIKDEHLIEMQISPPLLLGQRLHLLSKTKKVERAVRYKQRREIIMSGNCHVQPPGLDGKYELTQAYLKFTYEKEYTTEHKDEGVEGYCCFARRKITSETSTARFLDHVDISLVDDVDIKENEKTHTLIQPAFCWGKCCCKPEIETNVDKSNIIQISLNIKSDEGMFIAGTDDTETTSLAVKIEDLHEAEEFRNKLQDMMNEAQYMEGRGGSNMAY